MRWRGGREGEGETQRAETGPQDLCQRNEPAFFDEVVVEKPLVFFVRALFYAPAPLRARLSASHRSVLTPAGPSTWTHIDAPYLSAERRPRLLPPVRVKAKKEKAMGAMTASATPATPTTPLARALALAYGAAGIYAAYLTQGVVQEKLATRRYGPAGDRFPGLDALHGVQV